MYPTFSGHFRTYNSSWFPRKLRFPEVLSGTCDSQERARSNFTSISYWTFVRQRLHARAGCAEHQTGFRLGEGSISWSPGDLWGIFAEPPWKGEAVEDFVSMGKPIIPYFLGRDNSIYQLALGSPGVQGFDPSPHDDTWYLGEKSTWSDKVLGLPRPLKKSCNNSNGTFTGMVWLWCSQ